MFNHLKKFMEIVLEPKFHSYPSFNALMSLTKLLHIGAKNMEIST